MATFLFENIIFGPVKSRRLGNSLGVNLLPTDSKICNYNCVYCECGFNTPLKDENFPSFDDVSINLTRVLKKYTAEGYQIDTITFAGNGEPTLHPKFDKIIDETIRLRDLYYPKAKISVLSNALLIGKTKVFNALQKVDNNILKLDSAIFSTIKLINQPLSTFTAEELINKLSQFKGEVTIQTLFFKGEYKSQIIDNTTDEEVEAWLNALKIIKPNSVMIYSLDRDTPITGLIKASKEKLDEIGEKARAIGIKTNVY